MHSLAALWAVLGLLAAWKSHTLKVREGTSTSFGACCSHQHQ